MSAVRTRFGSGSRVQIGVISIAVLLGALVLASSGGVDTLFGPDTRSVEARFHDVGELERGSPVRVRGADVGAVEDIQLDEGGRTATVAMSVEGGAGPLFADAEAAIRSRTALGGNLAVEIDPGGAKRRELGNEVIPVTRTETQVELDEVSLALSSSARAGVRAMIRTAPRGLRNQRGPERALRALAAASPEIGAGAAALRGNEPHDLARLISNAADAAEAVAAPDQPIRELVEGAATTLRATANRQADVRETLRRAPSALAQTIETAARLDRTLELADPLIDALQEPVRDLGPTARALAPVLADADQLLADATPLLSDLRPTAKSLAATARRGAAFLTELRPSIRRLDGNLLPYLAERDPVSRRPTFQMVGPTFAALNGAAAQFDAVGHWFRFPASGGGNTLNTLPCQEYMTNLSESKLAECQGALSVLNDLLGVETAP